MPERDQGELSRPALRVGLVGAGQSGTTLLQLFVGLPKVEVVAVADPNPEAPGLALARSQGIRILSSPGEIFDYDPQIVIEVTGCANVLGELARIKPVGVELVGSRGATLLWEMLMLRAREAQQVERAETIRRMAGGIFHSLNNLLTTLLGRTNLLLRSIETNRWTPAKLSEELQVIVRTVTWGSEVLKRLRGLTRGSAEQSVTRVDVNAVVGEAVAFTDSLIREGEARSATIHVRRELDDVPPVVGRPSEILEVLMNLLVNAVEAMPEGGLLALETAYEGRDVLVRVRDTGAGIPGWAMPQLFTPFFTTKAAGTGLGLSVSREIVRRHGGDLAVESGEASGTCVTVRLPAADIGRTGAGLLPAGLGEWRVLVVDDDGFFRELLVELLTATGCRVTGAAGGQEALGCLKRDRYDLVLADIVMPDIPGWQVAKAARTQAPPPVTILFSGRGIRPDDPALEESGADAFIAKPFRAEELIETVRRVLATRPPVSG